MSFCIYLFTGLKEKKAVKSTIFFRSPTLASQNPETELILDGEDDNVSLLHEKEVDNVGGTSGFQITPTHSLMHLFFFAVFTIIVCIVEVVLSLRMFIAENSQKTFINHQFLYLLVHLNKC